MTIKLHDDRDPMEIGREAFEALARGDDIEIRVDRLALGHAFAEACEATAEAFAGLPDATFGALSTVDDAVCGLGAIEARERMVAALDIAYTLMSFIWDTTPAIREAEECRDRETGRLRRPESHNVTGGAVPLPPPPWLSNGATGTREAGPYDPFPDDDGEAVA